MKVKRLATFILVAGLGLVSGCRSNSCEGGLMSRFGWSRSRPVPVYDSNVIGTPVSSMPYGAMPYGGSYDGPALGEPTYMGSPGTIMPNMTTIPSTTLPPPMAGAEGGLRPVPGTFVPGTATPIPAGPSSRSRW